MLGQGSTTIGDNPIGIGFSPISELTAALARVASEIEADPGAYATEAYEPAAKYQAILDTIETMPTRTIADLQAKAEALRVELRKDYAWECDGDGMTTARSLAESIVRGLLALK